jgi:acyl-CoA synthetase (AMP-forming)/AMP-acid ligase II
MGVILPDTDYICESLIDLVQYRAVMQSDMIAYRFLQDQGNEIYTITYSVLAKHAKAIAAELQQQGVLPGERAILIYSPGLELIQAYLGCLFAGLVAVPVYPPLSFSLVEKLQLILQDCQPKILLTTHNIMQKLRQQKLLKKITRTPLIKRAVKHYWSKPLALTEWDLETIHGISTDNIPLSRAASWQEPSITFDHLAFLQYTSGSTGHPKGVLISHGNLLHNLQAIYQNTGSKQHIYTSWLPPYHDMGLIGGILQPLYGAYLCILMSPLKFLQAPCSWLDIISQYHTTVSVAPNFAYDFCAKNITPQQKVGLNLRHWEVAFNASEPIHPETLERFYEAFKECGFRKEAFMPSYGLAEATLIVSGEGYLQGYHTESVAENFLQQHKVKPIAASDPKAKTLVSCGRPLQEIRIVHPKTSRLCATDEVGEIWVHGPSIAKGYWQDAEKSHTTFHAHIIDDPSQTLYLRTGDLGFLLNGQLYVTGRLKDLIIIYGVNYYPHDIEHTVTHCHALIRSGSSAAFAIEKNSENRLVIVCEVKLPEEKSDELYLQLCQIICKAIADYHALPVHSIVLIQPKALPKTTSGKVRRRHTKELFDKGQLVPLYQWTSGLADLYTRSQALQKTQLEAELCTLFREVLGDEVDIEDDIFSAGGDSLLGMQVLNRINSRYQVELEFSLLATFSIKELAKWIEQKR